MKTVYRDLVSYNPLYNPEQPGFIFHCSGGWGRIRMFESTMVCSSIFCQPSPYRNGKSIEDMFHGKSLFAQQFFLNCFPKISWKRNLSRETVPSNDDPNYVWIWNLDPSWIYAQGGITYSRESQAKPTHLLLASRVRGRCNSSTSTNEIWVFPTFLFFVFVLGGYGGELKIKMKPTSSHTI